MKKAMLSFSVVCLVLLGASTAGICQDGTYYARCNLKVLKGNQVTWVNWQAAPSFIPVGTKLMVGDTLATGPGGSLGAILRDNSTMSLGPASSLVIRKFLFSPADGKLGLLVRVTRGTMAYLSGLIARLAPESARFETPVATIGTRGTRFAVRLDE